jgi:type I restriction enzyme S subunit
MTSEWRETTLGDVLTLQRGFDLPETQREPGSYPVIASTGPVGFHRSAMVKGPGVVIGRSGSLGGGQFITSDFWPLNTTLWVKDFKGNDPRFCYYLLKSLDLGHFNAGSGVPTLNRNHIHPLLVRVPDDVAEQRAISHILGTLDDKIELNRRMNETLESMAMAIFKSWFIDYDPVRAKSERRDPGLLKGIADLFPDRFDDSELGEIPAGWRVLGLDGIARFLNGLAMQKFPPKDGRSLPVIKIAQLRKGTTDEGDVASADLDPDYIIEDGDVLFSWSGSLECVLWAGGRGALNQHLFKVTSTKYPKWLYYMWILYHLPHFRDVAAAKATTMGHIQRHHLSESKVVLPPMALLKAADQHIGPMVDALFKRRVESRTIASIRDALLPKLVSGDIRIRDLSRIVGGSL